MLFDFGHTLVDFRRTEDALLEAYTEIRNRIEAALHIEVPEVAHLVDRVAREVDRRVEASYEESRLQELDLVAEFDDVLRSNLGVSLPPDVVEHIVTLDHSAYSRTLTAPPETVVVLRELRERGLRLGLVSNVTLLPQLMRQDLEALGLMPFLDATAFSSEVGTRKPDPAIFRHVLDRLGVDAGEAAFVGDRLLDDVGGARAVGMRTVLTREYRQETPTDVTPDAVIERLGELPGLLDRSDWRSGARSDP